MNFPILIMLAALLAAPLALADDAAAKQADLLLDKAFASANPDMAKQYQQDEAQKICSQYAAEKLPTKLRAQLEKAALASIKQPASGKLLGDWQQGEKIAQSGYGLRYTDDRSRENGGNCYGCHQITPQEVAYGTLGPSLLHYGKLRGQSPQVLQYTYNKIFNSHAYQACSNMPRFGTNAVLTPEQIADLVGLLLDPRSPVNK